MSSSQTSLYIHPPLTHLEFYILLALSRGESLHGYDILGKTYAQSLHALKIRDGSFYRKLIRMGEEGLLDIYGYEQGSNGKTRTMYELSPRGKYLLEGELRRMQYAVELGKSAGLMKEEGLPPDIEFIAALSERMAKRDSP